MFGSFLFHLSSQLSARRFTLKQHGLSARSAHGFCQWSATPRTRSPCITTNRRPLRETRHAANESGSRGQQSRARRNAEQLSWSRKNSVRTVAVLRQVACESAAHGPSVGTNA